MHLQSHAPYFMYLCKFYLHCYLLAYVNPHPLINCCCRTCSNYCYMNMLSTYISNYSLHEAITTNPLIYLLGIVHMHSRVPTVHCRSTSWLYQSGSQGRWVIWVTWFQSCSACHHKILSSHYRHTTYTTSVPSLSISPVLKTFPVKP